MCLSIAINHPDAVLATGEHRGFEWVVTHNRFGYRCGYVRVPDGHPWHDLDYDEIGVECHGGLTFAEHDIPCDKEREDTAYWVGFDCGHFDDLPDPSLPKEHEIYNSHLTQLAIRRGAQVRSQEYVEEECRSICEQAERAMGSD